MTTLRSHILTESICGFALIDSCEPVHVPLPFWCKLRISCDMLLHPHSLPFGTRHQGQGQGVLHFPVLPVCVRTDWEAVGPPETPICIPVRNAYTPNRFRRRSIDTQPYATKEGRKSSVCTRQGFMEHGVRSSLSYTACKSECLMVNGWF